MRKQPLQLATLHHSKKIKYLLKYILLKLNLRRKTKFHLPSNKNICFKTI